MIRIEALVVGLGIAGINMCRALEEAGIAYHVIDPCADSGSSFIAGGIYNPIVIKRKVKSWRVDELFPKLVETYTAIDAQLGIRSLYHEVPIIKPIFSDDELHEWRTAADSGTLAPYITPSDITAPDPHLADGALAQVNIRHSGFVDLRALITAYRQYLIGSGRLTVGSIGPERAEAEQVAADHGVHSMHTIWCTGTDVRHHPHFGWVPLRPTKGQMLTVVAQDDLPQAIYNKEFYLLPGNGRTHRLGATYEWHDLYSGPTQAATDELIGRVTRTMRHPVTAIDAQTAVRPNVADRRPLLGSYGYGTGQHLFNGMGSKGVMLAPYFAHQLVRHIWHAEPLDPEVDMMRFGKRMYGRNE